MAKPNSRAEVSRGFTLIELVLVITIAAVLVGITTLVFSRVQAGLATRSAVTSFLGLHAQARSMAVERGQLTRLTVNEEEAMVTVLLDSIPVNAVPLGDRFGVTLTAGGGLVLCFNPRGLAEPSCTSFTTPRTVVFTRGASSATVELLPMGQAREVQ
jgi:prepilin-type N-terminal cleavage/methylation domain-containing protein